MVKFAKPTYTKNTDELTTDIRFQIDLKHFRACLSNSHARKLRTIIATSAPLGEDAQHAALLDFLYLHEIVAVSDEEGGTADGAD